MFNTGKNGKGRLKIGIFEQIGNYLVGIRLFRPQKHGYALQFFGHCRFFKKWIYGEKWFSVFKLRLMLRAVMRPDNNSRRRLIEMKKPVDEFAPGKNLPH